MARTLVARRRVSAAADITWQYVADVTRRAEWDGSTDRVDLITPGPLRQGSRYRIRRSAFGVTNKEERQVVGFLDGAAITTRSFGGPVSFDSTVVVIPRGAVACEVVLTLALHDESRLGRVLGLATGLAAPQIEALMGRALGDLADAAQQAQAVRLARQDPAI